MKHALFAILLVLAFSACSEPMAESEGEGLAPGWADGAAATASEVHPLLPGLDAPAFSALTREGEPFLFRPDTLSQGAILVFYRGGWCPYCNRQLAELQEIDDALVALGYDLYFLSADSPARLSEGSLGPDLPFTLLSDNKMDVSKQYGVAYKVDQGTIDRYKKGGLDLAEEAGYAHYLLPAPSVFIVDQTGKIVFQYTNPDYRVRVNNEVLLTAARVFAMTD